MRSFCKQSVNSLEERQITETTIDADAVLATFNVKHYNVLKELKTAQPYEK
jgi:hypothetical protein